MQFLIDNELRALVAFKHQAAHLIGQTLSVSAHIGGFGHLQYSDVECFFHLYNQLMSGL